MQLPTKSGVPVIGTRYQYQYDLKSTV